MFCNLKFIFQLIPNNYHAHANDRNLSNNINNRIRNRRRDPTNSML